MGRTFSILSRRLLTARLLFRVCGGFKGHAAKKSTSLVAHLPASFSRLSLKHAEQQESAAFAIVSGPAARVSDIDFFARPLQVNTLPASHPPPTVTWRPTRPLDKGEEDLSLWVTPGFSCPLLLSFSVPVALSVPLLWCTQTQRQMRGVALYPLPTTRTFRLNRQNHWHLRRRCFFLLIGTAGDSHHFPTAELQPCLKVHFNLCICAFFSLFFFPLPRSRSLARSKICLWNTEAVFLEACDVMQLFFFSFEAASTYCVISTFKPLDGVLVTQTVVDRIHRTFSGNANFFRAGFFFSAARKSFKKNLLSSQLQNINIYIWHAANIHVMMNTCWLLCLLFFQHNLIILWIKYMRTVPHLYFLIKFLLY